MLRLKILLLISLTVWAMGSMVSAVASAAPEDPWWMKREQVKQVKINQTKRMQVKVGNLLNERTPFKIITAGKTVECQIVTGKGWVWNGERPGMGEGTLQFGECTLRDSECLETRAAILDQAKFHSSLMWKYHGEKKELEGPGQQKIYEVFAPGNHIEKYNQFFLRAPFMSIKVASEGTCSALESQLYAEGSTVEWELQQGLRQESVWGMAAQVEPQDSDQRLITLSWQLPNVEIFHKGTLEDHTVLQLGGESAEIEGKVYMEEELGGTEFGAWGKA